MRRAQPNNIETKIMGGRQVKISDRIRHLSWKYEWYFQFTRQHTVWWNLRKAGKSVLDLGAGDGRTMEFLNKKKRFCAVGLDIFRPHLGKCHEVGVYDDLILCDRRFLPFRPVSFDSFMYRST